jgi:Na+/H+ antiporter NhaA
VAALAILVAGPPSGEGCHHPLQDPLHHPLASTPIPKLYNLSWWIRGALMAVFVSSVHWK